MLGNRETKKQIMSGVERTTAKIVAPNTVKYTTADGRTVIRLHQTDIIVRHPDGRTVLNSGGWRTVTTKARLNEFIGKVWLGHTYITQTKGIWSLKVFGKPYGYEDGITLHSDGTVTGAAPEGAEKAQERTLKAIREYARKYVKALLAGEVEAPSAGDCMGCSFREVGTGKNAMGTDHYEAHFKEGYFVPSLLVNAVKAFPVAPMVEGTMHGLWVVPRKINSFEVGIATRQLTSSITRFLKREFGIAT